MPHISAVRLGYAHYDDGREILAWGSHRFPRAVLVAQITDSDGVTGAALVWCRVADGTAYARAALELMQHSLIGGDPSTPYETGSRCQDAAHRPGMIRAASLVEMALWDLAGRRLGVPCHQMLGRRRQRLPAYAISAEEFSFSQTEEYLALAERFVADGFRGCKFHLTGDADRDIEACTAIRRAVGDDVALMLDPAGRYDRASALRVGQALAELGFDRLEDPISPHDFAGYRWLSQRVAVPLAVNDALHWNLRDCERAARNGFVHCLRTDPGRAGICTPLAMAAVAETHGVEIDFAALAPYGGVETCLHLAMASKTARWFERHFASGVDEVPGVVSGVTIVDGMAIPAEAPGWGMHIDWQTLDRYCAWVQ
jgi:L-alanine-DL-glutamate epimerase-like enolase superfamily enzyme